MSDAGDNFGAYSAYGGSGADIEAAAFGLEKIKARAILYVRILGWTIDTTGSQTNEDISGLRSLVKKRNKSSEKVAKRAGQTTDQATILAEAAKTKMSEAELAAAMLSKGFVPVRVQYNPSSVKMYSVGGKIKKFSAMGNETMNSMTSTDKKTSTYLSVTLIYEDINLADAFGTSGLGVNVSDAADAVKSTALNAIGIGYSVKKPVEGLISLLMTKETRQIIFVWNNMFFHGELISVNANFTMFNKLGNPIRATVDLQIQQTNGDETFASDKQYWDDAFDAAFGV